LIITGSGSCLPQTGHAPTAKAGTILRSEEPLLLVRHAPGAPGVVYELTDPTTSATEAVSAIEGRFPAAALAQLEFDGDWSEMEAASLMAIRLPG
jgi:phosphohistidine phosphatase SixA